MLMAFPDAEILQFSREGIEKVDYRQTEHFQITKQFMDYPEQMLHYLLEQKDE
jgi:predicted ATPase